MRPTTRPRLEPLDDRTVPAVLTVTTTADTGPGSFRNAISQANAAPGADDVRFNIPGPGVHTIAPASALPEITDTLTIDGTTQPGWAVGAPVIELSGANAGSVHGLDVRASNSVVRGLVIDRFYYAGISLSGGTQATRGVLIAGNFIGTDPTGAAAGNGTGIDTFLYTVRDCTVGGTTPADRNVISGNWNEGLAISDMGGPVSGFRVLGNYIGTDKSGAAALENGGTGVYVLGASGNTIAGNVIGASGGRGIFLQGSDGNVVTGNLIGVDATGTVRLQTSPVDADGVFLLECFDCVVGGDDPTAANVVAGFDGNGIRVDGFVTDNGANRNRVVGNFVGTDRTGTRDFGNTGDGVAVGGGASANVVARNTIAFNHGVGVHLTGDDQTGAFGSTVGNTLSANAVYANRKGGIALVSNPNLDLTANDAGDADAGPNNLQNFPVLTGPSAGTLDSLPNTTFRIEFFASAFADAFGRWEGQTYLGSVDATTDAGGHAAFAAALPALPGGQTVVTATATNLAAGDTSEFSVPLLPPVVPPPPPVAIPVLVGFPQFGAGADAGGGPLATLFNPDGTARFTTTAFDGSFTGGVRIAAADFNRDGVADLVIGTGPGGPSHVRVLDGKDQHELFAVDPFEASFTGGVFVAAGDLTGDGVPDLVITPDEGGGPRCRVFSGAGFGQVADFFGIDDPNFRGGCRAAVGDVNGDGAGDLIVAAGFGGGPRVAGFDGRSLASGPVKVFADFLAFEAGLRNGTYVAAGDTNGDGRAEVVAGGGPGGGPRVSTFDGASLLARAQVRTADFFAGDTSNRGGARVAVKNLDGDSRADLIVGAGTGAGSRVTGYAGKDLTGGSPPELFALDAFPGFAGGVFVG